MSRPRKITPPVSQPPKKVKLLTTREALIILLALITAVVAGLLTCAANHSIPEGFLAGGTAFAGAYVFFDSLIG